jgi:RNA-directed DNA polymerase
MSGHVAGLALAALGVNGPEDDHARWEATAWRAHEENVRRLRQRIFTASQDGDLAKVRNLQNASQGSLEPDAGTTGTSGS